MATKKITLKADKRKILGRKVKKLRKEGILPANLFGKNIKSQALQTKNSEFKSVYEQAGETNLVYLVVNDKDELPVLISNVQVHPVTSNYLHADFYQVDLTKKVTVNVPVNLIGESPAVKDGAVMVQILKELEVEALPTSIPESIDFDISNLLKIGDSLKIKDAKDLKDAKITQDENSTIIMIQAQKEEEVQKTEETEEGVSEDEKEEKTSEGESEKSKDEEKGENKDKNTEEKTGSEPAKKSEK